MDNNDRDLKLKELEDKVRVLELSANSTTHLIKTSEGELKLLRETNSNHIQRIAELKTEIDIHAKEIKSLRDKWDNEMIRSKNLVWSLITAILILVITSTISILFGIRK